MPEIKVSVENVRCCLFVPNSLHVLAVDQVFDAATISSFSFVDHAYRELPVFEDDRVLVFVELVIPYPYTGCSISL